MKYLITLLILSGSYFEIQQYELHKEQSTLKMHCRLIRYGAQVQCMIIENGTNIADYVVSADD